MAGTDDMMLHPESRAVKPEEMSAKDRASYEKLLAEPGFRMIQQIVRLKNDPRLLILVSHGFIELMINALIDEKLKNAKRITSDNRGYPHSVKLLILNEVGILDDNLYKVFDGFRKLRNRAAHEPLFELTAQDLQKLNLLHSELNNFDDTVQNLVLGFWNLHTELFVRTFMPSQHDVIKEVPDGDAR
jgi:hypothetical protein